MKKLVSALLLCSTTITAHSMDAKKVVGRYLIDPQNCDIYQAQDLERAYVTLERDRSGRESLEVNFYGSESQTVSLDYVGSRVINSNFPLRSAIMAYVTKVEQGVSFLKNTQLNVGADGSQKFRAEQSLEAREGRLIYRHRELGATETCVLTR